MLHNIWNPSSLTRVGTCVPVVEVHSPNHWTTREVPSIYLSACLSIPASMQTPPGQGFLSDAFLAIFPTLDSIWHIINTSVDLKNGHNLKIERYVLFGGNFLRLLGQETASQVAPKELFRGGRGVVMLYRSLQQRASSLNIKSIFVNYRKQAISS